MKEKMTEKEAVGLINKNKERAEKILKDPTRFQKFIASIVDMLKNVNFDTKTKDYIRSLAWIIVSYWKKEYKKVPLNTILAACGALLYLVIPVDIIPDYIPGIGHIDDIAVINCCIRLVKEDLDEYLLWRKENKVDSTNDLELVIVSE